MENLIPIINKLQDVFATVGTQPIDLPQIVVVGSQSVGKSSVLENIVGRDFLPRGCNIVTRRPLILQLFNTSKNKNVNNLLNNNNNNNNDIDDDDEDDKMDIGSDSDINTKNDNDKSTWGEFLHRGSRKYFNFNEIRKEIQNETNKIAPNKAISSSPINLKIYSPSVLNLTLVDLPGMTRVPVGNQPKNIEQIIRKLILSFILKPNCLILAISSATADLATSDAIQLARIVDPKGLRTLGVITKIDLMDKGTNALNLLNGNIIPLKLGYIGIINRSQQDINNNKSIYSAKVSESIYFRTSPIYRSISSRCGTDFLSYKLNKILINHIKKCLPSLRETLNLNILDLENEIASYGDDIIDDNKGALLLNLISKFSENFNNLIDGSGVNIMMNTVKYRRKFINNNSAVKSANNPDELFGGARILYIFDTQFQSKLHAISAFDGLSDKFILNSMRNASGIRNSLFIPEMCFENLVKIQIEKLRKPCLNCLNLVFNELKRITLQSQTIKIKRFNKFKIELNNVVNEMLKEHLNPCVVFINQSIDIELSYIKTNHPDFISMDDVFVSNNNDNKQSNNPYNNIIKQQQQYQPKQQQQYKPKPKPKPKPNPNVWVCHQCTLENQISDKKCSVCDAPREFTDTNPFATSNMNNNNKNLNNNNYNNNNNNYNRNNSNNLLNSSSITQREKMELIVIKKFILSYFNIVKKNIADVIPKSIMFKLVNKSKQKLQQNLALKLYKIDKFKLLLSESPEIKKKRDNAKKLLNILQKALKIINQVRDYQVNETAVASASANADIM